MSDENDDAQSRLADLPAEFTLLERRADGLLICLAVSLTVCDLTLFLANIGSVWRWAAFAAAVGVSIPMGLLLGWYAGRKVAAGMFMPPWARVSFLFITAVALGIGVWLAISPPPHGMAS